MVFQPYSSDQIVKIVQDRLGDIDVFEPRAIQLAARKVASVTGDVRRALNVLRQAAEIWEQEGVLQAEQARILNAADGAADTGTQDEAGTSSQAQRRPERITMTYVTKAHTAMFNAVHMQVSSHLL